MECFSLFYWYFISFIVNKETYLSWVSYLSNQPLQFWFKNCRNWIFQQFTTKSMGFCSFSQIPIFWECIIIIFIVNFYWIPFMWYCKADSSFLASEYSIIQWAKCFLNLHLNLNLAVCLKGKVTNFQKVNWHKYLIKHYIIPKGFSLKIHFFVFS